MESLDRAIKFYVDAAEWAAPIFPDDFIVTVGVNKSNSVYHVFESRQTHPRDRVVRNHIKAYKSDLVTALCRDASQKLIPVTWNSRKKKN